MNYPLWDLPAPGLLIAFIAIIHVFISHFAVGGGLFLVLTERKARREGDQALLAYVERHSRFFALLTLVAGALTGVGIWFTIALVHPAAVSALVTTFVWGWAIEWTFFATEIAAAIVYAYSWNRLDAVTHMRVGWIYFITAWLSLVVINGILAFMLTPGEWITTRSFWDGVLNPTYWPSVVARTAGAVGLAGVYALMTASWMAGAPLKPRLARYAAGAWIMPAAIVLPLSVWWYLAAAAAAGVPVADVFGAAAGTTRAIVAAAFTGSASGHPIVQRAVVVLVAASVVLIATAAFIALWRRARYGRISAAVTMICGLAVIGSAEWIREGLRKPFVIGSYMFVTGVRLPPSPDAMKPPASVSLSDRFDIPRIQERGVLATAKWARPVPAHDDDVQHAIERGRELFRLSCSTCHTMGGYLAIRPLVKGMSIAGANGLLTRLARPVDREGHAAEWNAPELRLASWRGRMMPPFPGTPDERQALAAYLAHTGGMSVESLARAGEAAALGARVFDENCSVCHGPDGEYPFTAKGRFPDELYALIGRLPQVNDMMAAFEGSDDERRALAEYLATLEGGVQGGAR